MKYYVYILRSRQNDSYYIGQTQNVQERLIYHNSGRSNYTGKYRPWELIAYKEFATRSEAMKEERKMKNLKSRSRLQEAYKKRIYDRWHLFEEKNCIQEKLL